MNVEELRKHIRRQPFEPFRLYTSDGSAFEVRHPEMIAISQREVVVGQGPFNTASIPESFVFVDPRHITHVEIDRNPPRRNGTP